MSDEEFQCVFVYEADPDQPCWGDCALYDASSQEMIFTCEGHWAWSLAVSHETNRKRYEKKS